MDCEHPEVEHTSDPVRALKTLTYRHVFTCTRCGVEAVVIEHVAVP